MSKIKLKIILLNVLGTVLGFVLGTVPSFRGTKINKTICPQAVNDSVADWLMDLCVFIAFREILEKKTQSEQQGPCNCMNHIPICDD